MMNSAVTQHIYQQTAATSSTEEQDATAFTAPNAAPNTAPCQDLSPHHVLPPLVRFHCQFFCFILCIICVSGMSLRSDDPRMDGWMNRWMDGWMDGWMDEQMDGWMDGWMNRWMDRWMDFIDAKLANSYVAVKNNMKKQTVQYKM